MNQGRARKSAALSFVDGSGWPVAKADEDRPTVPLRCISTCQDLGIRLAEAESRHWTAADMALYCVAATRANR